jgi:hypothetical protein
MSHSFNAASSASAAASSVSATGGVGNNATQPSDLLARLRRELLSLRYTEAAKLESDGFFDGNPRVYVSLLQFCIFGFSRPVSRLYADGGYSASEQLTASVFLDAAFRFLAEKCGVPPAMTVQQFLTPGSVEKKAMYLVDVIRALKHKHNELYREKQAKQPQSQHQHQQSHPSTFSSVPASHPSPSQPQQQNASPSPPNIGRHIAQTVELGATLRQSLVIPNAVNSREKKETNREALDRFDQVVVPLDEDNPTVGTRVVEVNMQELFTMMVSKMERMEMRVMNVLTKGLDALNARVSVLERRMNGM